MLHLHSSITLERPGLGSFKPEVMRTPVNKPCRRHADLRAAAAAAAATDSTHLAAAQANIKIQFSLPYHCNFGQFLCIVGAGELLGNWNVREGLAMGWRQGDLWAVDLEVQTPPPIELEYKYVVRNQDGSIAYWKPGANVRLSLFDDAPPPLLRAAHHNVHVRDAWDGQQQTVELLDGLQGSKHATDHHAQQHGRKSDKTAHTVGDKAPKNMFHAATTAAIDTQQTTVNDSTSSASSSTTASTAAAASNANGATSAAPQRVNRNEFDDNEALQMVSDVAFNELQSALLSSLDLQGSVSPDDPRLLAADQMVAACAQRALNLSQALQAGRPRHIAQLTEGHKPSLDFPSDKRQH